MKPAATDLNRSPRVRRFLPPGLGDLRLWLGVGLLLVSTIAGAALLVDRAETVQVMQATRALSAGAALGDLRPVSVPVSIAERYLPAEAIGAARPGGVLRWPIGVGELVPIAAIDDGAGVDRRAVTVPVDPNHAPPSLAPGDLVDVWTTSDSPATGESASSRLVLANVPVSSVAAAAGGFTGALGVTLDVPTESVGAVVRAARGATVDLVAVPLDAQTTVAGSAAGAPS